MNLWLTRFLAVGVAGFVGSATRYAVALLAGRLDIRFPLGTLIINVTGSCFLGWFLTHAAGKHYSDTLRLAIGTGFVGAYTTFSTYMFESNKLMDDGAGLQATVNLLGSLILGILAVRLGIYLGGGYRQ